MTFDLDVGVDHCEGCGCITGNQCGLCSRCLDDEYDWMREKFVGVVDPHGTRQ